MKLIMENWRKYLDEESTVGDYAKTATDMAKSAIGIEDEDEPAPGEEAAAAEGTCVTVRHYRESLVGALEGEERKEKLGNLWKIGKFVVGTLLPGSGKLAKAKEGAEFLIGLFDLLQGGSPGEDKLDIEKDKLKEFPILRKFKMDPELVYAIEDKLFPEIQEGYKNYLSQFSPETCIDEIPNISEYAKKHIADKTNRHVVIKDES